MKPIRNEKGYALLFVMLLVVLFTIMGMGLFTMNMNAAKQFSMKEKQVAARHQAEMGILHYKAEIAEIISLNPRKVNLSCTNLTRAVSGTSEDGKSGYTVKNEDIQCNLSNGVFTISVMSKGDYLDREDKIRAKLYVKNMRGSTLDPGEIPEPNDYDDTLKVVNDNNYIFENGTYTQTAQSLQMKKNVTNKEGNGNRIIIERNFYINGDMDFTNHACLVVRGDLVVKGDIKSINKIYTFVYGDVYYKSISATSSNNVFFVSGNEYVNGVKMNTKKFNSVPSGSQYYDSGKTCTLSSPNPGAFTPIWDFNGEMEVDYFVD